MPRNNQDSHLKNELREAIVDGLRNYLSSTRGCNAFGTQTGVIHVDGAIHVEAKIDGKQRFFEVIVKAPWS